MIDQTISFETIFVALALTAMAGAYLLRRSSVGSSASSGSARGLSQAVADADSEPVTLPSFKDRLAVVPDFVPPNDWQELVREITALTAAERSYVPTHKKGGTIAYATLREVAPSTVAFYRSAALSRLIGRIVGETVRVTPLHDQNSCSVLIYDRPGDHIGWHYDHNFYRGRHFTVLIPIVNDGVVPGTLSAARLLVKRKDDEAVITAAPNTLVVFEGAKVLHKVTPIQTGERRIVLSMTFATDPTNGWLQGAARRVKDMAFFGVRALWT